MLTNNAGVMSLHERFHAVAVRRQYLDTRRRVPGAVSTLCFKTSEDAAINSESEAIRMAVGGVSAIQGQDGMKAVMTFIREVPIDRGCFSGMQGKIVKACVVEPTH